MGEAVCTGCVNDEAVAECETEGETRSSCSTPQGTTRLWLCCALGHVLLPTRCTVAGAYRLQSRPTIAYTSLAVPLPLSTFRQASSHSTETLIYAALSFTASLSEYTTRDHSSFSGCRLADRDYVRPTLAARRDQPSWGQLCHRQWLCPFFPNISSFASLLVCQRPRTEHLAVGASLISNF